MTAAATLGVAGCSVFSPPTVLKPYEPSDGAGATLDGVKIRNVLLVSGGVDEPGVLSAVLVNSSPEPVDVSVSVDVAAGSGSAQTYSLAENSSLHIGDPGAGAPDGPAVTTGPAAADDEAGTAQQAAWLQVPQVPVVPGQTVPVTFTVNGQETSVAAQVMLPCFEYAAITPTAPAATPTTGATPADEATATSTVTAAAAPAPTSTVTCGPQGDEEGTEPGAEDGGEEEG